MFFVLCILGSSAWEISTASARQFQVGKPQTLPELKKPDISGMVRLPAHCGEKRIWFAGKCRGEKFFKGLLPKGQKLVSISGSRSKLLQTIAAVYAQSGNDTLYEYLLDDEGQGASTLQIQQQDIQSVLQQGKARATTGGIRHRVAPKTLSSQKFVKEIGSVEGIRQVGGVTGTLGGYKVVRRTLSSQGYISGKGFTYEEVLTNQGGRLLLYHSVLKVERTSSSYDFYECTTESYLEARGSSGAIPGCYTGMAIAQSGSGGASGPPQACGPLIQELGSFLGWGVALGCGAYLEPFVVGGASELGIGATLLVTLESGGQLELGIAAGLVTWGGVFLGGTLAVGATCDIVGSLAQDTFSMLNKCAQGFPVTQQELQDIYQHIQNAYLILAQLGVAAGGFCPSTQGVTETHSGTSDHCGGGTINCSRTGTQSCSLDPQGNCSCGATNWDDGGVFDCECR